MRKSGGNTYVFIHINKTGGSSISNKLAYKKIQHLTAKEVIKWIGREKWDAAETFTVVRNPWDKVASHYLFRKATNQTKLKENPLPFKEWVNKTYGQYKDLYYYDKPKMFMPQSEWIKDENNKVAVKHILRFEKLEQDFNKIARILQLEPGLPHLNKTINKQYNSMYDKETAQLIEEWFSEDIERFEYTFEHAHS